MRSTSSGRTATRWCSATRRSSDLSESQPTKGNIEGGLTTIEEKALGNIQKIGKKCLVDGVIDKAELPTQPGLWFMDSSSAAAEMVTLCAASSSGPPMAN
ncbi:UxaA family hydrolase [Elioraea sp.]|uniref:UxaA family hydrolase n=1 Tax=Elioraea sp. TaxID=2185103 RepID=UPI0025B87051|nr:UxaA family hydrolase [Elioraea sp.]